MQLRVRTTLIAAAAAALGLTIGGAVVAIAAPSTTTLTACVAKSTGNMRLQTAATPCKSSETPVSWNQAGQAGQDGADGVSGYETVVKEQPEDALGFFGSVSATCPTGKKVTGGGAIAVTADGGVQDGYQVINSSPTADSTGWRATFNIGNPLNDSFVLKVYAICATVG